MAKALAKYCKAYPLAMFRAYSAWKEHKPYALAGANGQAPHDSVGQLQQIHDTDILYLQENYVVTTGVLLEDQIVFDDVTPEWMEFCRNTLKFELTNHAPHLGAASSAVALVPDTPLTDVQTGGHDIVNRPMTAPVGTSSSRPASADESGWKLPDKLMNRHFLLLWQGEFVSQLGGQIYSIMLVFWLKHATDSASILGLMAILSTIPVILLSGLGGVLADRYSRRTILMMGDLVRGVLVLSVAAALYLMPDATTALIIWFVVITVAETAADTLSQPALFAASPDLVPRDKVTRANSLLDLTSQLSVFMGQGLGGMLYRLWGAPLVALFNSLSFLIAGASKWWIQIPQVTAPTTKSWRVELTGMKHEIIAGFRYSWNDVALRTLFVTSALLNLFITPVLMLLPFYIEDFLQVTLDWYGYMLAAYSVGIALGSLTAGYIKINARLRAWLIILFVFLTAVGAIVLASLSGGLEACIAALIIGMMNGFNSVNFFTIMQLSTPAAMRGRVVGFLNTLSAGAASIGMGVGGILYDFTGQRIELVFTGCAVMMMVVIGVAAVNPKFREILAFEPQDTAAPV